MKHGFTKAALISLETVQGAVSLNESRLLREIHRCDKLGAEIILSGRLALSGITLGSMFLDESLLDCCLRSLGSIIDKTREIDALIIVGVPIRVDYGVYDCSAVISGGRLMAVLPHESQDPVFSSYQRGKTRRITLSKIADLGVDIPFGHDILFENQGLSYKLAFHDSGLASTLADIVLRPLALPKVLGSMGNEANRCKAYSLQNSCAVLSVSNSQPSSSSEFIYSDHKIACELGSDIDSSLKTKDIDLGSDIDSSLETKVFDIDLCAIRHAKMISRAGFNYQLGAPSQAHCCPTKETCAEIESVIRIEFSLNREDSRLDRVFNKHPLAPSSQQEFREIVDTLTKSIHSKLQESHQERIVLGLSGGLDSTNALMLCYELFKRLSLPMKNIIAVTLNSPHTSNRTATNAKNLIERLGVTGINVPIEEAVKRHMKDINHSELDVVYENAQARERTQILLSLSNKYHALMLGTGDLSELALGWATFGGDLVSHYNPNGWLTKTAIRYVIRYFIAELEKEPSSQAIARILEDILDTPVSPELLENQSTESLIGDYELHDFFLSCLLGRGYSVEKTLYITEKAFPLRDRKEIIKTLKIFIERLFKYRFKHNSCFGSTVAMNPELAFCLQRIHSGFSFQCWLEQLEKISDKS